MNYDVQVYTRKRSPRLDYALDLVLGNILGLTYIFSDSPDENEPLINYSSDRSIGGIFIQPEGLLFEEGIRAQDIWVAHLDTIPLFFQQPPEAGFQLDIFSFAFYLVSRYEEYISLARDEYGRFAVESSLAYKYNFLDMPVVDIWARRLGVTLKLLYPGIFIPEKRYEYFLTLDVHEPFAYKGRGLFRNIGGLFDDLISGNKPIKRLRCMTGSMKDSYDTYDYINDNAAKHNCPVLYFFATGNKTGFDKKTNNYGRCYMRLIRKLSRVYPIGLHTSYGSGSILKLPAMEKERLEGASRQSITKRREHYSLLTLPYSYQSVQALGIEQDYSLGYYREAGFRAGIARPFKFYDLSKEEVSPLTVVPYQYMDLTYQKHKRYDPPEAMLSVARLIRMTKDVGGLFISIWHNTSLTDENEWEGWRRLFEYTLSEQQESSLLQADDVR